MWLTSGHSMTDAYTSQFVDVMAHQVLVRAWPGR
jgi:hypothetical protein